MSALATCPPPSPPPRSASRALTELAPRLGLPLWQAGQLARSRLPTAPTGWRALDAELPDGGWPLAGLTELLTPAASGELALLAPWLRGLGRREAGSRDLVWIAPPAQPCVAALQALGLDLPRLVCIQPASPADGAWAAEQALRAGSCAAVLWWSERPVLAATLRRLHLAAQAGCTPLMALRPPPVREQSSPAPLRLAVAPQAGRQLSVEVFKRRGPPMAMPLILTLPWPASALRRGPGDPLPVTRSRNVVDRAAPAPVAAAGPALVASRA